MNILPNLIYKYKPISQRLVTSLLPTKTNNSLETITTFLTFSLAILSLLIIVGSTGSQVQQTISPLVASLNTKLHQTTTAKKQYQVYGYAPYWTFDKLDNVDFSTLTTLAYFDIKLNADGSLQTDDPGYTTFMSDQATTTFQKAHDAGAKVNVTVSLMQNNDILAFLDNPQAQEQASNQIIQQVKNRGIDGVSLDVEYAGNPGADYQKKFTSFVQTFSAKLHSQVPDSQVTVAVYAGSARDQQLYDLGKLAQSTDAIFMMAYDFATSSAENAQPTAPLYGYKKGKYPYDVATAVDDFLKVMPANKLILGVPYYGYNYPVSQPEVKSQTLSYWASPAVQTYSIAQENVTAQTQAAYRSGWDDDAKVSWRAYQDSATGTWRMIFLEDEKSLGIKYDFAKSKNLAGVGIWALGFDEGHRELWSLLREKFGTNLADSRGAL